jgi:zinc and cadmium transporter
MELYITAGLIMLASLSGLIFLVKNFNEWLHYNAKFVIVFSAGIFSVVAFNLLFEAFEFSTSIITTLSAIILGFFIFQVLEYVFPELHHHDHDNNLSSCVHSRRKVIWGDALHNIGDGILLAFAFAVDVHIGFIAGFAIFVHEFVQEVSEFSILKLSGYSTKKALIINFLVSATIIPGVILGTYLIYIESFVGILFGLAAGIFLHLVFVDLIPQSIAQSRKDKKYFTYIFLIIAGIFTILAINQIGGGHGHGEEGHTDEKNHVDEEVVQIENN